MSDDGGAAFPMPHHHDSTMGCYHQFHAGMTLRDYFAGQALAHIPALLEANEKNKSVQLIAEWAYQVADAMIKARRQAQ
jgi:hypothetical protein